MKYQEFVYLNQNKKIMYKEDYLILGESAVRIFRNGREEFMSKGWRPDMIKCYAHPEVLKAMKFFIDNIGGIMAGVVYKSEPLTFMGVDIHEGYELNLVFAPKEDSTLGSADYVKRYHVPGLVVETDKMKKDTFEISNKEDLDKAIDFISNHMKKDFERGKFISVSQQYFGTPAHFIEGDKVPTGNLPDGERITIEWGVIEGS